MWVGVVVGGTESLWQDRPGQDCVLSHFLIFWQHPLLSAFLPFWFFFFPFCISPFLYFKKISIISCAAGIQAIMTWPFWCLSILVSFKCKVYKALKSLTLNLHVLINVLNMNIYWIENHNRVRKVNKQKPLRHVMLSTGLNSSQWRMCFSVVECSWAKSSKTCIVVKILWHLS